MQLEKTLGNWSAFFFGPCWLAYRKMHAIFYRVSPELNELLSENFSTVEKLKALNISERTKSLPDDVGKLKIYRC